LVDVLNIISATIVYVLVHQWPFVHTCCGRNWQMHIESFAPAYCACDGDETVFILICSIGRTQSSG